MIYFLIHHNCFNCVIFIYTFRTPTFRSLVLLHLGTGEFDSLELVLDVELPPHGLQHPPGLFLLPLDDQPARALRHEHETRELHERRDAAQTQHVPGTNERRKCFI